MSSQEDESLESTLERFNALSRLLQHPWMRDLVSDDSGSNDDVERDDDPFSNNNLSLLTDWMQGMVGLRRAMIADSPEAERAEYQVRGLLLQAEIAEDEFDRQGSVEQIDQAITYLNQALSLTPDDHDQRGSRLSKLGNSHLRRFRRVGELIDIDKAIEYQTRALKTTPDYHTDQPDLLNDLGNSHLCRFELLGESEDISKAIEYQILAVLLISDERETKPDWLRKLGHSCIRRFLRLGDPKDIGQAVEYHTQALALTPDGHAGQPQQFNALGTSYFYRFDYQGDLSDIDQAINYQSLAVLLTPDGNKDKPDRLNDLGNSHALRFQRLDDLADLDKAIEYHNQALILTCDNPQDRIIILGSLGTSYNRRFERLGGLADLDKGIEYLNEALEMSSNYLSAQPDLLSNLGISYFRRFERLGELADIDTAIDYQSQSVVLTPEEAADKPSGLHNLGTAYMCRFERLGELTDIHKAIEYQTQAVMLTPNEHADKPMWLTSLGNSYRNRYKRLGDLADVDKAIDYQVRAVLLAPEGHASLSSWLSSLGSSYMRRSERLREPADLDRATECRVQAALLMPDDHASKPVLLNDLGNSFLDRFRYYKDPTDVDKAICHQIQALGLTPDDHAYKPNVLTSLGSSYLCRFNCHGAVADADQAIECLTQAVLLTADSDANKPSMLNNLGFSYQSRFGHLGALKDIDKAIECKTQAVSLTPNGHAAKPTWLYNLGESYRYQYDRFSRLSDGEMAHSSFQQAALLVVTDPAVQLKSAHRWAQTSVLLNASPRPAYERVIALIPHLVWLGMTIDQRYSVLTELGSVTLEASSWAIAIKDYNHALDWLEAGRSVVWNQILQLRRPIDSLTAVNPALSKRLEDVSRELELAGLRKAEVPSRLNIVSASEQEAQRHRRLATEWDQLLGEARGIPGFDNFMRPHTADALMRVAKNGPVIVISLHQALCHALIIQPTSSDIADVPLDNFSTEKAIEIRAQLMSAIGQRAGGFKRSKPAPKPEDLFKPMLVTLWLDVVKPILDFLGYREKMSIDELPRVTWCTTGALSFLPLHAAGPYDGSQPNTFDLVVSSYTPTLSALLAPSPSVTHPCSGVLAVGQEQSEGLSDLPNTVQELAAIKEHTKATRFVQIDGKDATIGAVLQAMDECSWVHLACHAVQNPNNPSHSAFLLHDGNLTLETIAKRSFKNKGLAFLSACQTATGDKRLPDEAIHLAAGMLMAGYPSVIATMWSIFDVDGPEVAGRVYAELLWDGGMDHTRAARALHKAVAGLREKAGLGSFERWVPFIHIGV